MNGGCSEDGEETGAGGVPEHPPRAPRRPSADHRPRRRTPWHRAGLTGAAVDAGHTPLAPTAAPKHRGQGSLRVALSCFTCGQMTPWRQSRTLAPGLWPVLPSLREKALCLSLHLAEKTESGTQSSPAALEPGFWEWTPQRGPGSPHPSRAPGGPCTELKMQLSQTTV